MIKWLCNNWIEVLGTVTGTIYVILSIKQSILTWVIGIISSILYIYVYLDTKFYADMSLQFYYLAISFYGWYYWVKGIDKNKTELKVSRAPQIYWIWIITASIILFAIIKFILLKFTDSPISTEDAITTALSIVATWMLTRKYIEHWIFWIFIDTYSIYLYLEKELYPTSLLFTIYSVMAIVGFLEWRKKLNHVNLISTK